MSILHLYFTSVFVLIACVPALAQGPVVNADFRGGPFSGQGAIASPGNTWNLGASLAGTVDSQGNPTGVGYTLTGGGGGGTGLGPNVNETLLFNDYFHSTVTGLTIRGLPTSTVYNLAFYGARDANDLFASNNEGASFTINAVSQSTVSDKATWNAPYVLGNTHVLFSNVNASPTGAISVGIGTNGVSTQIVNGFQIAAVDPVPASGVVNVDFRASSGSMAGAGALPDPGNNFWNVTEADSASNLIDSTAFNPSTIGYTLSGITSNGGTGINGNENELTADYKFSGSAGGNLTINGLDPGTLYDLILYGASDSRDLFAADGRGSLFTIDGDTKESTALIADWIDTYVDGVTHASFGAM